MSPHKRLKPSARDEYLKVHAQVWPGVLAAIARAHIVDYSIHYYEPLQLLIAHFKYVGEDWDTDMKTLSEDAETQRWWSMTDGMQESFQEGAQGSGKEVPWWTDLPEVFRFDGDS